MDPSTFRGSIWGVIRGGKYFPRKYVDPYIHILYLHVYIYNTPQQLETRNSSIQLIDQASLFFGGNYVCNTCICISQPFVWCIFGPPIPIYRFENLIYEKWLLDICVYNCRGLHYYILMVVRRCIYIYTH